jgi:hypothetical protein
MHGALNLQTFKPREQRQGKQRYYPWFQKEKTYSATERGHNIKPRRAENSGTLYVVCGHHGWRAL